VATMNTETRQSIKQTVYEKWCNVSSIEDKINYEQNARYVQY